MAEHLAARERDYAATKAAVRTAAVHAEKLVGTPEWDAFQHYVQARIDDAEAQVRAYTQQLVDPRLAWDAATVSSVRGHLALWTGRRDAFREALLLPHDVIHASREAPYDGA